MDLPITKAGAHMIDVDDVKEALNLWDDYHKFQNKILSLDLAASNARVIRLELQHETGLAAYREQCEAVSVLKARNIELEQQLAEARMALDTSQGQVKQLEAEAWLGCQMAAQTSPQSAGQQQSGVSGWLKFGLRD